MYNTCRHCLSRLSLLWNHKSTTSRRFSSILFTFNAQESDFPLASKQTSSCKLNCVFFAWRMHVQSTFHTPCISCIIFQRNEMPAVYLSSDNYARVSFHVVNFWVHKDRIRVSLLRFPRENQVSFVYLLKGLFAAHSKIINLKSTFVISKSKTRELIDSLYLYAEFSLVEVNRIFL